MTLYAYLDHNRVDRITELVNRKNMDELFKYIDDLIEDETFKEREITTDYLREVLDNEY